MVELRDVTKVYDGRSVVDHLSFKIPPGTCYGLLGPNGAGKTTTISILAGIVKPDSGEVWINGDRITSSPGDRHGLYGYVPQELALYEELSALDNLKFFGALYNLNSVVLNTRIDEVVEIAQLQDRLRGPVRQFSGGMKRRLNLAISLLHNPDLLILDEPTVGVDPQSRNLIFEALERLIQTGKTILYTTHYMEEIERLCSRVAIMDQGRLIADDSIEAVMKLMPPERTLVVTLQDVPRCERLNEFPHFADWQPDSRTLRLKIQSGEEQIMELLDRVQRELAPIVGIQTQNQTLEQLFLYLTGRRLRD